MRRFVRAALAALYLTIPALAVETLPEDSFSAFLHGGGADGTADRHGTV